MSIVIGNSDLVAVRLNYSLEDDSTVAYNQLYYRVGSVAGTPPPISQVLSDVATAMYALWSAPWAATAAASVTMTGVTVTSVFPLPRSVAVTHNPGTPTVGSVAGGALPLQDSITLLKTSDVGNRWGLGRMFVVGVPEASQADGRIGVLPLAAYEALASKLNDAVLVTGAGYSLTCAPVLKSGPEDNPTRITPITGGRVSNDILKTQRRRRPGKGS